MLVVWTMGCGRDGFMVEVVLCVSSFCLFDFCLYCAVSRLFLASCIRRVPCWTVETPLRGGRFWNVAR